jgi:hypothetical protein
MYTLALREYIRLLMKENLNEVRLREADITGDKKVPWGSDEHISDLEKRCSEVEYWRNKHPKGSAKRSHYQTVLSHLKNELKSAHRESSRRKMLSEKGDE